MNGEWVSYSGMLSARLELHPDGTGLLALKSDHGVQTFRLSTTDRLNGAHIDFVVEPVGDSGKAEISVLTFFDRMELFVHEGDDAIRLWLERESSATADVDALKQSVASIRSGP